MNKAIKIIKNEIKKIDYKQGLSKLWKKKDLDYLEVYRLSILIHRKDVLQQILKKIEKMEAGA